MMISSEFQKTNAMAFPLKETAMNFWGFGKHWCSNCSICFFVQDENGISKFHPGLHNQRKYLNHWNSRCEHEIFSSIILWSGVIFCRTHLGEIFVHFQLFRDDHFRGKNIYTIHLGYLMVICLFAFTVFQPTFFISSCHFCGSNWPFHHFCALSTLKFWWSFLNSAVRECIFSKCLDCVSGICVNNSLFICKYLMTTQISVHVIFRHWGVVWKPASESEIEVKKIFENFIVCRWSSHSKTHTKSTV